MAERSYGTHQDVVDHISRVGVIPDLPPSIQQAYKAAGLEPPREFTHVAVVTPPLAGVCNLDGTTQASGVLCPSYGSPHSHCAHCGVVVPDGQHRRAHAVAGAQHATHPETGEPLRLQVDHCDACVEGPACDPAVPQPAGHCEPHELEG